MASGAIGGSTPQLNRGPELPGHKALYYSIREIALIKDKTVQAGYGVLRAGTIMAENISAAGGKGKLVPYVLAAYTGDDVGRALALADIPSTNTPGEKTINVLMDESYKFVVGDDLIIANDSAAIHEGGAIASIDRTTHPHYAIITFTTGIIDDATYTVANNCCCYVEAGTTPFSKAKYILDKDVDTGVGEIAQGAITPVLISNAILYTNSLINLDSAAATTLGTVDDGQHTILK